MKNNILNPLVSVITVCFNESQTRIDKTFKSIKEQTYKNIQHIIIDGGSNGNTIEAIQSHLSSTTIFVTEPDNGIYDAMNKGAGFSTGEIIVFMNIGDSFYSSETIATVVDFINEMSDYDIYYGDFLYTNTESIIVQENKLNRLYLFLGSICHQTVFARRYIFENHITFPSQYKIIADQIWLLKSISSGAKSKKLNIPICEFEPSNSIKDTVRLNQERIKMHIEYYLVWERILFSFAWLWKKTWNRIKTKNYLMPVSFRLGNTKTK